jgi:hypothetical protein
VIEVDLGSHKLELSTREIGWLRAQAAAAAGSSSAASEIAGRIAAITLGQRRILFRRSEARALRRLLEFETDLSPGLAVLGEALEEMFGKSEPTGSDRSA